MPCSAEVYTNDYSNCLLRKSSATEEKAHKKYRLRSPPEMGKRKNCSGCADPYNDNLHQGSQCHAFMELLAGRDDNVFRETEKTRLS